MKKANGLVGLILYLVLILAPIFGWGRCIYKSINCNWSPIGKAEIIYTAGVFTGTGAIIGYFNIDDK